MSLPVQEDAVAGAAGDQDDWRSAMPSNEVLQALYPAATGTASSVVAPSAAVSTELASGDLQKANTTGGKRLHGQTIEAARSGRGSYRGGGAKGLLLHASCTAHLAQRSEAAAADAVDVLNTEPEFRPTKSLVRCDAKGVHGVVLDAFASFRGPRCSVWPRAMVTVLWLRGAAWRNGVLIAHVVSEVNAWLEQEYGSPVSPPEVARGKLVKVIHQILDNLMQAVWACLRSSEVLRKPRGRRSGSAPSSRRKPGEVTWKYVDPESGRAAYFVVEGNARVIHFASPSPWFADRYKNKSRKLDRRLVGEEA